MLFLFVSHVAIDVHLRSYTTVFAGIHVIICRIWMLPVRHWCLHCTLGEGRMAVAPLDQSRRDEHTQWFSCNSRYSIPIWSISIGIHSPLSRIFKYSLAFALFRDAETSTPEKTYIIQFSVGIAKVTCAWPAPAIWKPVHPLDLFYQRRPRVDSATLVMTCYNMLAIYEHKSDIIRQAIQLFYQSRSAIVGQPC